MLEMKVISFLIIFKHVQQGDGGMPSYYLEFLSHSFLVIAEGKIRRNHSQYSWLL